MDELIPIYRWRAQDWHPRVTPDAFVVAGASASEALTALNARMAALDWSWEDEDNKRIDGEPLQFDSVTLVDCGGKLRWFISE